jgi:hypothetical protein
MAHGSKIDKPAAFLRAWRSRPVGYGASIPTIFTSRPNGKAPQPLSGIDGEPLAVVGLTFVRNESNNAENPADS